MAARTISVAGGNYNAAGTWDEGFVPTSSDDVVARGDGTSGNLTINVSSAALSFNMTNYSNTLTVNNTLTVSGSVTLVAAMTITTTSGTPLIIINANSTLTSNGKTWPYSFQFGSSSTFTLADNWVVGHLNPGTATINGFQITTSGNLSHKGTGVCSGTTNFIMNGTGTWDRTSTGTIRNNLTFNTSGTITVSGTVAYDTGTLTYTAGIVVTSGSSLLVNATTTLDVNGITWNNVTLGAGTRTLTSNLSLTGTLTLPGGIVNNGSIIGASGNINITATGGNVSGTTVININGSNQTINSVQTSGRWSNNITIASTGTVYFTTGVKYTGVMTHVSGTVLGLIDIDYPPVPASIVLDGSNEYINIDAVLTALASTTVGTISAWVKVTDISVAQTISSFSLIDGGGTSQIMAFDISSSKLRGAWVDTTSTKWAVSTDAVIGVNNTWIHVAIVQDGISPVLYINGSAPAQTFTTSTNKTYWFKRYSDTGITLNTGRMGNRQYSNNAAQWFVNGQLGLVQFWNTNLTAGQITTLYNSGQSITPANNVPAFANLVSSFNLGLGDTFPTATDSVGGNNGTYTNSEVSDILIINRTISSVF